MGAIWLLTKKNLKLLVRAKSSALIVVFAPLLIMLTLGLTFNTSSRYGIKIGVHAPAFAGDANSFVEALQQEQFEVVKYDTSIDQCVEDIKIGLVHTCISLPTSFAIEGNTPTEITFYVDPTRVNLVYMVQETLKEKFNLKAQEITQQLATDLLGKLNDAKTKIAAEKEKITAIKEKNSAAASSSDSLKSNLAGLDLHLPTTIYDINAPTLFQTNLSASLASGKDGVSTAKAKVQATTLNSSTKASITTVLDDLDAILSSAVARLTTDTGAGSYATVTSLVQVLLTDVDVTKNKLNAALGVVNTGVTTLGDMSSQLSEGASSLGGIQSSLGEVNANLEAQKTTEASVIASPLVTKIERIQAGKTYLNYLLPALLIIVIMFSSLLLGTTLVMMEKNSAAFTRNFFLPIRKITFILATYLTNLILIAIQVVIILAIAWFFLEEAGASLSYVALILFIAASVFTFLGMAIGYIFVSEETGVLASISVGSLLLFISGVILPLESMPTIWREITSFNPFVIAEKLIREVFLFESPFQTVWLDFLILVGYALIWFLVVLIIETFLHEHLINKFMKHHHKRHREEQKMARGAL